MSDFIIKYAGTGLSAILYQVRQQNDHIEFLDPICTMLKLCVLGFKPVGTKISIRNNTIITQDNNYLQTFFRSYNNDCREHIYQLKCPILYFKLLESGILTDYTAYKEVLMIIKRFSLSGLNKLKSTYEMGKNSTMINCCLNDYIRILKKTDFTLEDYKSEMNSLNGSLMTNIYSEFMKIWSVDELIPIKLIFNIIEKKSSSNDIFTELCNIDSYSNAINSLIEAKEKELNVLRH